MPGLILKCRFGVRRYATGQHQRRLVTVVAVMWKGGTVKEPCQQ
ncbi:hypothetical protein ACLQ2C_37910 [Streptomyces sp. DT73]